MAAPALTAMAVPDLTRPRAGRGARPAWLRSLLWFGVLAGCGAGGTLPIATQTDASRAHVELASLQRGRSLVASKCGSCHRPPLPSDHGAIAWPREVDAMAPRAHLDVAERDLVERYFVTMAAR
jgi:hypothetical protein